jgi:hypothetical protein
MMGDISAIASALGALKAAKDIGSAMINLRDEAAFREKLIEFQSKILDANNAAFAVQEERVELLQRIGELEKNLAEANSWEREKQRYQLKDYGGGTYAYELKAGSESGEPPHKLCVPCLQTGKKGILHFHVENAYSQKMYKCSSCDKDHWLGVIREPPDYDVGGRDSSWLSR